MGIGSNWGVEVAEQDHEDALFEDILYEAAILISNGIDRQSALNKAEDLINRQQEAISNDEYSEDENGYITFFDSSLEGSSIPQGKELQVKAIMNDIR